MKGVSGVTGQVSGLIGGSTIKVASKVPDLAHRDDIWDGYKFFWKDKEDEGRYFSALDGWQAG